MKIKYIYMFIIVLVISNFLSEETKITEAKTSNMDVTAFSGDNFDAKDWINKALRSSEPGQSKEDLAGSLVMKLKLMRVDTVTTVILL